MYRHDNTMKYQTTKEKCQKRINELNNVCDRCGRKIKPMKTVDNSGSPTFWAGCFHGSRGKYASGHYTRGVTKEIFNLAEKLVCDGERFSSNFKGDYKNSPEERLYWFQTEVKGFCGLLGIIEWLKKNKPRKTKNQFLKDKYF